MQLADSQERHAQLDEAVINAERRLNDSREQQRSLERQAQEAQFSQRSLATREAELKRIIDTAAQQASFDRRRRAACARRPHTFDRCCRTSWLAKRLEHQDGARSSALAAKRSEYDDLTTKLRASDERRLQLERELEPLRQRITDFQLKEQAARLGLEQYTQLTCRCRGRPRRPCLPPSLPTTCA